MVKKKVKALLEELLSNWIDSMVELVEECCRYDELEGYKNEYAKMRIDYEKKIEELLK